MNKTAKTVSIGRTLQSCPCHACAFFTSKEEEYRVMLPFMAEGFEAGDKLDDRFHESCHMQGIHPSFQTPIYAFGVEKKD